MRLLYIIYCFWNNTFYQMVQGMSIASFSPVTVFIRSINENYKSKDLLAKVEKVLSFLSFAFFSLE